MTDSVHWKGNWAIHRLVLALSLVPFVIKALDYAWLGSLVPLMLWLLFAGLIVWGVTTTNMTIRCWTIRLWALALIIWSLARFALLVLHFVLGLPEAHLADQMSLSYALISLLHLVLGGYLFRISRTVRT